MGTTTNKGGNKGGTGNNPFTFVKPQPVTPQQRKGTSTVPNPVGVVWVTCLNVTHQNGGVTPPRGTLHRVCTTPPTHPGKTVTYHTVRTQVNRYLQWVGGGCNPNGLPKGVTLPSGFKPFKLGKGK